MSQNLTQDVSLENISFNIPASWVIEKSDININTGKIEDKSSFTLNVMREKIDLNKSLISTKDLLLKSDFFKNAAFSEPSDKKLKDINARYVDYNRTYNGTGFKGGMITFQYKDFTYLIMYLTENNSQNTKLINRILDSLKFR